MEEIFKNILFIDDQYESYLPVLEPIAYESGYAISVSEKVTDGIIFLHAYSAVTDVVILDLSFPTGEMQGKEGLRDIIRLFPHIPVIILTDSDTADDLGIVVECMKLGAYNYVGKSTLNPVYLFQVIHKAVDDYRRKKYITETKKTSDDKELFHTVIQKFSAASESYQAIFGFELVSVNKPSGKDTRERLYNKANNWHQKLIKAINTPYKDALKINLRYISNGNKKVTCRMFFSVYAEQKSTLSHLIRNIQEDIKLLFSQDSQSHDRIYSFYNISEDSVLTDSLNYKNDFNYYVAFRKPITVSLSNQIGFSAANSLSENLNQLFPLNPPALESNAFIKALATSNQGTALDIELHARNLKISEIDFLKRIISQPNSIKPADYGTKGELWLKQYLNNFIEKADEKCFISLLIIQKNDRLNHNLKTAIADSFIGSGADFRARRCENLMRFGFNADEGENQLPFCCSLDHVLQGFRLPLPDEEYIEGIDLQSAATAFLPDNLPDEGFRLGEKKLFNGKKEIMADASMLTRHLYIMGQTGTGKTTLMKTMIGDCIDQNKGFALIDPHGDLFSDILQLIPERKREKVIIVDTVNPASSVKHNPLIYDPKNPQMRSLIINELLKISGTWYNLAEVGGPQFELYFKNGLLLIMDEGVLANNGQTTLKTFVQIFYDVTVLRDLLKVCKNRDTVRFFENALKMIGDSSFSNWAPYITSKLSRLTDDIYVSPIICNRDAYINFRELIDEQNILLVRMDKGLIGSSNASLMGQLIISNVLMAAMSRTDMDQNNRKPFYLFIDEFQNFLKGDIATALPEARKYGLNLIMANQTLGQLDTGIYEALLGNVGSFVFFRPGINDYEKIKHYIEPEFERHDVLKLPNFNCIGRLLIDNIPSDPFVFQTVK